MLEKPELSGRFSPTNASSGEREDHADATSGSKCRIADAFFLKPTRYAFRSGQRFF